MTIEARALLGASRKRTVHMVQQVPRQCLEIELPADMTKRMRSFEESSFVTTAGPRSTISALELTLHSQAEKSKWCAQARVNAIIGSCSRSLPSVKVDADVISLLHREFLGKRKHKHCRPHWTSSLLGVGLFAALKHFQTICRM